MKIRGHRKPGKRRAGFQGVGINMNSPNRAKKSKGLPKTSTRILSQIPSAFHKTVVGVLQEDSFCWFRKATAPIGAANQKVLCFANCSPPAVPSSLLEDLALPPEGFNAACGDRWCRWQMFHSGMAQGAWSLTRKPIYAMVKGPDGHPPVSKDCEFQKREPQAK